MSVVVRLAGCEQTRSARSKISRPWLEPGQAVCSGQWGAMREWRRCSGTEPSRPTHWIKIQPSTSNS